MGKIVKTSIDHNFSSELRFGKMNSCWKGIEEEKPYINPKIDLSSRSYSQLKRR
jgi:hypothetical protein